MILSATPYIELLLGGSPLQLLHSLLFCINDYDTLVVLLIIKLLFILLYILKPKNQALTGITLVLPFILLRDVDFAMCLYDF